MPVQTRQQKRRLRQNQPVCTQPHAIGALPVLETNNKTFPPEEERQGREECAICLEPVGCCRYRLRCGHAFHVACMREWIASCPAEARCPVCRGPVRPAPWQNLFENGVVAWIAYKLFLAWMEGEISA